MIRTKAPLTKPTIPHNPLRGLITAQRIPTRVRRRERFVRGEGGGRGGIEVGREGVGVGGVGGGGEGRGGDDEVGLTAFLGGHDD